MDQLPIIDISPLYTDNQNAWPAVAEQIDHAKTWKKGLLQQMFV